jgi:hypothetical protein
MRHEVFPVLLLLSAQRRFPCGTGFGADRKDDRLESLSHLKKPLRMALHQQTAPSIKE